MVLAEFTVCGVHSRSCHFLAQSGYKRHLSVLFFLFFFNLSMTYTQNSASCVFCNIFSVHSLLMRITLVSLGSVTFSCDYSTI